MSNYTVWNAVHWTKSHMLLKLISYMYLKHLLNFRQVINSWKCEECFALGTGYPKPVIKIMVFMWMKGLRSYSCARMWSSYFTDKVVVRTKNCIGIDRPWQYGGKSNVINLQRTSLSMLSLVLFMESSKWEELCISISVILYSVPGIFCFKNKMMLLDSYHETYSISTVALMTLTCYCYFESFIVLSILWEAVPHKGDVTTFITDVKEVLKLFTMIKP